MECFSQWINVLDGNFLLEMVATFGGSFGSHIARDAKLMVVGVGLIFGGVVVYIWHASSTSKVLAIAISCSA